MTLESGPASATPPEQERPYNEYRDDPPRVRGRIWLYRMPGDIWRVAHTPEDAEYIAGLSHVGRIAYRTETMAVTPRKANLA